ncbi:mytilin-3 [Mytilus californianus]|uniref:Mytilin-3 n=1 Tax=Mytilus californianus TaxID=6549 RepID=MYT3_MYTCA|nr:mytilin-3 [Mytilus californianus]P86859.1 RecName: Full=Mytilin-3; AltName: Full=Mytilus uncharacterized protein 3; Short=MUSP-3; Flags: Precursor [Mytilus californianus]
MLKGIILIVTIQLVNANFFGVFGKPLYNPFNKDKYMIDFITTFNKLMNMKQPQFPHPKSYPGFPPLFPGIKGKKSVFKTIDFTDMAPGSKKTFRVDNGQGIAFRSKSGNAGGMSFSSGTGGGKGFAFGGTLGGGSNGEFVMSQSGPGLKGGKVTYSKGVPKFAKGLFGMLPFFK